MRNKYLLGLGGALLATTALATAAHLFPDAVESVRHFAAASGFGALAFGPLFGTTSSANTPRMFEDGDYESVPVADNVKIYEGSAVGDNGSGYAQALQAGNPFRGFCVEGADNTISGHSAGGIYVQVRRKGRIHLPITGAAITDVGRPVYASDDMTFTYTASGNSYVGRVCRYESSTEIVVEFDMNRGTIGNLNAMVYNTGATGLSTSTTALGTFGGTVAAQDAFNQTVTDRLNRIAEFLNN